jgi:iron(III) transport system substrate-binding protein
VAGNSQAAELVARGAYPLGLTDTDDYWRLKLKGLPIGAAVLDPEGKGTAFLIPNTVAILRGAPHPEAARKFVDGLLAPEIEEYLAFSTSRQIPVRKDVKTPEDLEPWLRIPVLKVRYEDVAESIDPAIRMARDLIAK